MDMKQLALRALEETIAYRQANPLPEMTLIDTDRDVPFTHGDITKLVEQAVSISN